MSITRLSGGLTPEDGSDPRTFPAIWNATADSVEGTQGTVASQGSAIVALEADVDELETRGFRFVETVYFTSNGTFNKADYPWLRAIRVKCQGAGGGSGGCASTGDGEAAASGGGGGGAYAESFITDIAGLDASVAVTRGAGGAGGAAGDNAGSNGGNSSFGSLVVGNGGNGGGGSPARIPGGAGGFTGLAGGTQATATGDLIVSGSGGEGRRFIPIAERIFTGSGGHSFLGGASVSRTSTGSSQGDSGGPFGGGASGSGSAENQAVDLTGNPGGNGIVIVELFA